MGNLKTQKIALIRDLNQCEEHFAVTFNWKKKEGKLVAETAVSFNLSEEGAATLLDVLNDFLDKHKEELKLVAID